MCFNYENIEQFLYTINNNYICFNFLDYITSRRKWKNQKQVMKKNGFLACQNKKKTVLLKNALYIVPIQV